MEVHKPDRADYIGSLAYLKEPVPFINFISLSTESQVIITVLSRNHHCPISPWTNIDI